MVPGTTHGAYAAARAWACCAGHLASQKLDACQQCDIGVLALGVLVIAALVGGAMVLGAVLIAMLILGVV